jgi:serine protease Do
MRLRQFMMLALVGIISAVSAVGLYKILEPKEDNSTPVGEYNQPSPSSLVKYLPPVTGLPAQPVDFTVSAAITTPAVVHVKTSYKAQTQRKTSPLDLFRDFFGEEYDPYWLDEEGGQQSRMSSGSGVIISKDGYIVTNNHVIHNADQITVSLHDNRTLKAELIGTDPATDLALLKIADDVYPHIAFGNSDSVKVGQWVLAVGNPFELESTVTAGIVSAKGRNINILRRSADQPAIESFIQTDAAINPGNSGGALVSTRGELIGINTAIATPTGTFAGYSFAVPVNIVKKVIGDLMDYGVVQRAYLGVMIDVNKDDLSGVYISDIIPGSASADSELEVGDVITEINGYQVSSFPELQEQISKYTPGERVKVEFIRSDRTKSTYLTLKNAQKNTELVNRETAAVRTTSGKLLGATLEPLTLDEMRGFEVEQGVRVKDVGEGLIGSRTRINEGFVITHVNESPVSSVDAIEQLIKAGEGATAMLEGFYPDYPHKIFNYSLMMR